MASLVLLVTLAGAVLGRLPAARSAEPADSVAGCQCIGIDYLDDSSYFIDVNVKGNFTFVSQFNGNCTDDAIIPTLEDTANHKYLCSEINPSLLGAQQISTCGVSYSGLTSGVWTILFQAPNSEWTLTRKFKLQAGIPSAITAIQSTAVAASTPVTDLQGLDGTSALLTPTPATMAVDPTSSDVDPVTTLTSSTSNLTQIDASSVLTPSIDSETTTSPTPPIVQTSVTVLDTTATVIEMYTPSVVQTTSMATFLTATVVSTRQLTTTLAQATVTSTCQAAITRTLTSTLPASVSTIVSTVVSTVVDSRVTNLATTVKTLTASCVFSNPGAAAISTYTVSGSVCVGVMPPWLSARPTITVSGTAYGGFPWGTGPPAWVTSRFGSLWASCTKAPARTTLATIKASPRRTDEDDLMAEMDGRDLQVGEVATTTTYTQTAPPSTVTVTNFGPSLTVTRLSVQTVVQTITPPAKIFCAFVPDVTKVVEVPGPKLLWVTIITTTTHVIETTSVTSTSLSILNDITVATACLEAGGRYGIS